MDYVIIGFKQVRYDAVVVIYEIFGLSTYVVLAHTTSSASPDVCFSCENGLNDTLVLTFRVVGSRFYNVTVML